LFLPGDLHSPLSAECETRTVAPELGVHTNVEG